MKCPECNGTGKVVHPIMSMNGDEYTGEWEQHECEACNGTGEEIIIKETPSGRYLSFEKRVCKMCNGTGKLIKQTNFEFMQSCTIEQLNCFICAHFMNGLCGECKFMKSVNGRHTCGLRDWLKEEYKEL